MYRRHKRIKTVKVPLIIRFKTLRLDFCSLKKILFWTAFGAMKTSSRKFAKEYLLDFKALSFIIEIFCNSNSSGCSSPLSSLFRIEIFASKIKRVLIPRNEKINIIII